MKRINEKYAEIKFQFNHCTINSVILDPYLCPRASFQFNHCTINSGFSMPSIAITKPFQFNHCTINRGRAPGRRSPEQISIQPLYD